jgi:hypothetical protein
VARYLLKVVENHQALATPRDRMSELSQRIVLAQWHSESLRYSVQDAIEASGFGQVAEPYATGMFSEGVPPEPGDEPCLAGAPQA